MITIIHGDNFNNTGHRDFQDNVHVLIGIEPTKLQA